MSDAWLVARGLVRSYHTGKRDVEVLRGVDLDVSRGEVVAITGPSGSGKSTLLNLLGSLDRKDGGSILWGDDPVEVPTFQLPRWLGRARPLWWTLGIVCLPVLLVVAFLTLNVWAFWQLIRLSTGKKGELARSRNRSVGFVFQFHHLLGDFTALENVTMPAEVGGGVTAEATRRGEELLERMGLADRAEHRPGELSGGEQQRVAVARALMNEPRLILADEPAGNLDHDRALELHRLILDAPRDEGAAVVIVTHDDEVARRADRWLHLSDGVLREHDAPDPGTGA